MMDRDSPKKIEIAYGGLYLQDALKIVAIIVLICMAIVFVPIIIMSII